MFLKNCSEVTQYRITLTKARLTMKFLWLISEKKSANCLSFSYLSYHQNSAIKRAWARVVLSCVTTWEVLVLHPFLFLFFLLVISISSFLAKWQPPPVRASSLGSCRPHVLNAICAHFMSSAIIPELMHQILSELRS